MILALASVILDSIIDFVALKKIKQEVKILHDNAAMYRFNGVFVVILNRLISGL